MYFLSITNDFEKIQIRSYNKTFSTNLGFLGAFNKAVGSPTACTIKNNHAGLNHLFLLLNMQCRTSACDKIITDYFKPLVYYSFSVLTTQRNRTFSPFPKQALVLTVLMTKWKRTVNFFPKQALVFMCLLYVF